MLRTDCVFIPIAILSAVADAHAGAVEQALSIDLGGGVSMEFVLVKAGAFLQGSPPGEAGRGEDETQREATISADFYMARLPVTRGQFARFVAETGHRTEAETGTSGGFGLEGGKLVQKREFTWRNPGFPQTDDHPVVIVTYPDAEAFDGWLSRKAFRRASLPTEAQWEFACRAGTASRFHGGESDEDAARIAWFSTRDGTRPAGKKAANALGLHDMSGNVWEWCRDWYGPYPPGPAVDPVQTRNDLSDKPRRVLRGGSWMKEARHCSSAARFRNDPRSRNADNGFRPVLSVETQGLESAAPPASAETAAPLAPFPVPTAPQKGFEFLRNFIVVAIIIPFIVIAISAIAVMVKRAASRMRIPEPASLRPSPTGDGFWVDTSACPPGSTVRYRYMTPEGEATGSFVADRSASGQFIYTGQPPAEVSIIEVVAAEAAVEEIRHSMEGFGRERPARSPREDPFRGHPSAY